MASYWIPLPKSSLTSSGSYIEGYIDLDQTKNEATLSSLVTIKLYVRKGNDAITLTEPTAGTWSYKLQSGSIVVNETVSKSVLTNWVHLYTLSLNLKHAADGTLSVPIIASITAPSGTTLEGKTTSYNKTVSIGSIDLPTTVDSLTCSTAYLDGIITAKYTPKLADFYNQCKTYVMVDGKENEIYSQNLGKKSTSQQTYTIQFTADQLSKIYGLVKTTINVTIRVKFLTYRNSAYTNYVGTYFKEYLEIVLTLPTSVAPTASLNITKNISNSWIKGKNIYVAGLSGLTATLSATPSAGIKAEELTHTITYDGATYNAKTLNVTTLKKSGNIVAKVTDPRGRYATVTEPINVLSYSAPAIASIQVERGTYKDGWTPNEEGPDVKVVFKTTLSLTSYDNSYSAAFKIDGSSKTPNYGATTGLKSGTDCTVYFLGINGEASHTLALTVTDLAGGAGTANLTIPTINITIEFRDTGKGIAFGKTSEKDAFECAMNAEFSGSLAKKLADNSLLEIDDTGWISMGTSSSVSTGTDTGRNGPGCYYRVINKRHVYVVFNAGFTFSGSAIVVNGTALPAGLRPKRKAYAMNLVSGRAFARTGVNTSGNVVIDWVQNIASAAQTESASTTWIDGYVDYWI